MSTIRIGTAVRRVDNADAQWVHDQIRARQLSGENPCVRVDIETDRLNVAVQTDNCQSAQGARRKPNPQERAVLDLWQELGLQTAPCDPSSLVTFLLRVRRLL